MSYFLPPEPEQNKWTTLFVLSLIASSLLAMLLPETTVFKTIFTVIALTELLVAFILFFIVTVIFRFAMGR